MVKKTLIGGVGQRCTLHFTYTIAQFTNAVLKWVYRTSTQSVAGKTFHFESWRHCYDVGRYLDEGIDDAPMWFEGLYIAYHITVIFSVRSGSLGLYVGYTLPSSKEVELMEVNNSSKVDISGASKYLFE